MYASTVLNWTTVENIALRYTKCSPRLDAFFTTVPFLLRSQLCTVLVGQLSSAPSTGSCQGFPSVRSLGNQLSPRSAILCGLPWISSNCCRFCVVKRAGLSILNIPVTTKIIFIDNYPQVTDKFYFLANLSSCDSRGSFGLIGRYFRMTGSSFAVQSPAIFCSLANLRSKSFRLWHFEMQSAREPFSSTRKVLLPNLAPLPLTKRYNLYKVLACSTTFFQLSLFCATFF